MVFENIKNTILMFFWKLFLFFKFSIFLLFFRIKKLEINRFSSYFIYSLYFRRCHYFLFLITEKSFIYFPIFSCFLKTKRTLIRRLTFDSHIFRKKYK